MNQTPILIFLLVVIVLSGCVRTKVEDVNRIDSTCDEISDENKKFQCYMEIYRMSIQNKNVEYCDKIGDTKKKQECLMFYVSLTKNSNPDICGRLDDLKFRDSCYETVATSRKLPELCKKIENKYEMVHCFDVLDIEDYTPYFDEFVDICTFIQNPSIKCKDAKYADGNIIIDIINALGTDISDIRFSIKGCKDSGEFSQILSNGMQGTFNISCKVSGEFSEELIMYYKIEETKVEHKSTGKINIKI